MQSKQLTYAAPTKYKMHRNPSLKPGSIKQNAYKSAPTSPEKPRSRPNRPDLMTASELLCLSVCQISPTHSKNKKEVSDQRPNANASHKASSPAHSDHQQFCVHLSDPHPPTPDADKYIVAESETDIVSV